MDGGYTSRESSGERGSKGACASGESADKRSRRPALGGCWGPRIRIEIPGIVFLSPFGFFFFFFLLLVYLNHYSFVPFFVFFCFSFTSFLYH